MRLDSAHVARAASVGMKRHLVEAGVVAASIALAILLSLFVAHMHSRVEGGMNAQISLAHLENDVSDAHNTGWGAATRQIDAEMGATLLQSEEARARAELATVRANTHTSTAAAFGRLASLYAAFTG